MVDVRSERMLRLARRLVVRSRDRDLLKLIESSDKAEATSAWGSFRKSYPLVDSIDLGQMKLLRRAEAKLRAFEIEAPELERYAGISRFLWVRSAVTRRVAFEVSADLRKRGLNVCVLKGLALCTGYGIPAEEHPMWDADLLPDHFGFAMKRLVEIGFKPGSNDLHATSLTRKNVTIDLHRFAVTQDPTLDLFMGGRVMGDVIVPSATNCFLHSLMHGVHSDALWIFDAEKLYEKVNFALVLEYARKRCARGLIGAALSRIERTESLGRALLQEASEAEYLELVAYATRGRRGSHHWVNAARRTAQQLQQARAAVGELALPKARIEERWVSEWES
jgi:hypothetical protein